MFVVHNDMTIYATRGDVVYFPVEKKVGDAKYQFQPGDIVRIRVCEKKNYSKVFLLKDFVVEEATTSVNIFLDKWEMKFGDIINKPTDYWYEVELNPDTFPDTIIGHNEKGAAVFKLFPEAKDVVEGEIPDQEENSAVSRMVVHFVSEYLGGNAEDIIIQEVTKPEYVDMVIQEIIKDKNIEAIVQEIVKEGHIETIVKEVVKEEHTETIVQEIIKPGNVETIVQEIIKEENTEVIVQEILKPGNTELIVQEIIKENNLETIVQEILREENTEVIVQEILKPENTEVIVQEVLKEENTTVIVEQVMDQIPGHLVVTLDDQDEIASHSAAEINEHIAKGGSVVLKRPGTGVAPIYADLYYAYNGAVIFNEVEVAAGAIYQYLYIINNNKVCTTETMRFAGGGSSGGGEEKKPVESVYVERNGGLVGVRFTYTDDSVKVATITLDENDTPQSITINGNNTTLEWSGI